MAPPKTPVSLRLAGRFRVPSSGDEGIIETASRIDYPDGRIAFLVEYDDVEEAWELRLESRDGRHFRGTMSNSEDDFSYPVKMQLWVAPDDPREWLLVGVWVHDEDGEIDWSVELFVDDE